MTSCPSSARKMPEQCPQNTISTIGNKRRDYAISTTVNSQTVCKASSVAQSSELKPTSPRFRMRLATACPV